MVPETEPSWELFREQEANRLNIRMTSARMPKAFFTWQFPSPPSRRAQAPLRRDGGWEGSGVGWFLSN
jgi:hypothetical protein